MDMSDQVLALLTTSDGTAGGLLTKGERLPEWFARVAERRFPEVKNPKKVEWDKLTSWVKRKLLKDLLGEREQDFDEDRVIHGLRLRKKATLTFREPTLFMGKVYGPGTHKVRLSGLFLPYVEARGPKAAKDASGIEIHARNAMGAGNLSRDARTFQKGAGIPVTHQHGHVVASKSVGAIPSDPELEAVVKGDYARRANLASEMISIVQGGKRIWTKEANRRDVFGSFRSLEIEEITSTFEEVARGKKPKVGDEFKIGAVGIHFQDKYDAPGLWGMQVRRISRNADPEMASGFLDAIQYGMTKGEYGLSSAQIEKWWDRSVPGPKKVAAAWYNQGLPTLFDKLPGNLKALMDAREALKARQLFFSLVRDHLELKMLLFDWRQDPVVFLDPALATQVAAHQEKAVIRLIDLDASLSEIASRDAVNAIMRDFLVDSGLYEAQLGSVGLRVTRAPGAPSTPAP
jgi:hypothetical protein